MYLVTAQEMAELDRTTIEDVGIPGIVLMENAARESLNFFLEVMPDLIKRRVSILVGPGNNGGDGLAIGRLLYTRGAKVTIFCVTSPETFKGDALTNYRIVSNLNIPVYMLTELESSPEWDLLAGSEIIIDALLGTGLQRDIKGLIKRVIERVNSSNLPVFSVDIPSGVDGSTGKIRGAAFRATATATFGLPKIGHVLWPGMDRVGKLKVVDIGIPPSVVESKNINRYVLTRSFMKGVLEPRARIIHKGQAGHLAVLAGSAGKTGAAGMVAFSALRTGAGLVTVMIPKSLNPILEVKLTEPMTLLMEETEDHSVALQEEEKVLSFIANKQCLVIGPGSSLHEETQELIRRLIINAPCPVVVDADAITAVSKDKDLLKNTRSPIILTPHPGEMARLLGCSPLEVQTDRLKVAESFSEEFGVVLVLKGHRTIIAHPSGKTAINVTGNPAMASGGMGDILSGMIGALVCQGIDPFDGACMGVYVHGLAADRVVSKRCWGTRGLTATDLLEEIPVILRELEEPEDTSGEPLEIARDFYCFPEIVPLHGRNFA